MPHTGYGPDSYSILEFNVTVNVSSNTSRPCVTGSQFLPEPRGAVELVWQTASAWGPAQSACELNPVCKSVQKDNVNMHCNSF